MEIICISAGCLTIAVVLCVAPASFHNNTSKTSIQRTARIGFLIHAVTHNIAQVAIFSLGLISSTKIVQPITTMAVLVCLLAFAAMGSTQCGPAVCGFSYYLFDFSANDRKWYQILANILIVHF